MSVSISCERLEAHRANPVCASCHAQLDPLGLALEPFDAIGGLRTHDGDAPIDASVTLPDGSRFVGPAGVREHLLGCQVRFVSILTEKLLSYALGRGLEDYDAPAVRRIVGDAEQGDYRWSSLVVGIGEGEQGSSRTRDKIKARQALEKQREQEIKEAYEKELEDYARQREDREMRIKEAGWL